MKENGKSKGKGYIGKISNSGVQVVQAPFQQTKQSHTTVKHGDDLRNGKGR